MNLADYLSELLGQYEEVSVPGLGYFVRERVNGYYNDGEARFYPPQHRVKFIPQPKEDDLFAQYVADKKNISLASSKYFAEKFVSKLKEQAAEGKYLFADLGLFYTEQGQLVFKPYDKIADDPAFYGYPPLTIVKADQSIYGNEVRSGNYEPYTPPVTLPPPVQTVDQQQYFEEEPERKRGINVWLVLLIAIAVIVLAVFGVKKFYPQAFDRVKALFVKTADTTISTVRPKADTQKKVTPVVKDSTAKTIITAPVPTAATPVTVADTATGLPHFAIIQHDKYTKESWAISEVKKYQVKGIDARILTKAEAKGTGKLYKIVFKTCHTQAQANALMLDLVNEGKINQDLEILPINNQQ
jgi:hypothetical protein